MKNLLTGYIVTVVALAAVDGASSIIHSLCDLASSSINLKTAQLQVEINKLVDSGETNTRAIGFLAPTEGDEEEYDDET